MCTRMINADESTRMIGRPACPTHKRILVPIAQGETPEVSLAVYVGTNKFRVDRRGEKVIERNPLAPIPCSQHGQAEMLASTGLGLSETATILWVKLLSNFVERKVTSDTKMKEVDGAVMTEMQTSRWPMTKMMGVEIALPCKTKMESTHWLIQQPLADAEGLNWNALKSDALGIWQTESNVYFIVPVGYQDVLFDELDEPELNKIDFFESNAVMFREACQKELDNLSDEEKQRKEILPELALKAWDVATEYTKLLQGVSPQCFGGTMPAELQFDEANEDFIYGGESERLTVRALARFEDLLKLLQQQVTEFKTQSQRAEGFRELLRELNKTITIKDYYGVLNQVAEPSRFGKTVEVELLETQAVVTVLKGDHIKTQASFGYTESGGASGFNVMLERLGLKEKDHYYDYDDIFDKPKRSLQEIFLGFVSAAKA